MTDRLPLVTLYLSERCNSRCISCDYWRHGGRDLTLDAARRLLPDLAALGTRDVLVSGGEPLLNPEWREIAVLLKAQGLRLWLLTSGLALAKHARAAAGLFDSVTVSLDGTNRETYAAIRGIDAFAKVCEGVRAMVAARVSTSLRVTLQRRNYRELSQFVALARELGVDQISFLAVDTSNGQAFARGNAFADGAEPARHDTSAHPAPVRQGAFTGSDTPARRDRFAPQLALLPEDIPVFDKLLDRLEAEHGALFRSGLIAESPARLRRIRDYFAALNGITEFPPVRCNAPEFSAVVAADGRVSPCFFIAGADAAPRAPELAAALQHDSMRALRTAISAGRRGECRRCVCSMWREPSQLAAEPFRIRATGRG